MCAGESSAIHPTPFVLADVDGETPWAVEGTDCLRCVCGNCQVVWCDCCVAPNTNPLGLPNIGGAVDRKGPFHMSCWEFPPGCVELRMVRIDEGQAGATDENRLLGSWGVGCESFWCRKGFRGAWFVCRSCSNLCWPSCIHCCLHVGHAGWVWWAHILHGATEMHQMAASWPVVWSVWSDAIPVDVVQTDCTCCGLCCCCCCSCWGCCSPLRCPMRWGWSSRPRWVFGPL